MWWVSDKSLRTPWGLLADSLRTAEGLLEDCWRTAGGVLRSPEESEEFLRSPWGSVGSVTYTYFVMFTICLVLPSTALFPPLTLVPDLSCEWVGKGYSFLWVIYLLNLLVYHPQPCHFQYMLLSMPPLMTLTTASSTSPSPAWLCCFGDNHAVDASWDDALFTGVPLFVWKDHHQHSLVPDFIGKTSFPHFDQLFGGIGRWNFSMFPFLNDHSMYS